MSRALWFLALVLLSLPVSSQERRTGLEAGAGLANNRMDDMKYLQEYLLTLYPVEGRVISSFPAYSTGSIRVVRQLYSLVRISGGYAYTATGGRNNYTDYTGSITTDMAAASHRVGIRLAYAAFSGERYDISAFGQADAAFTRLSITSSLYVLGISESAVSRYRTISPNITGGLEATLHFGEFSLGLQGGYLVDIPGELSERETGAPLDDPQDSSRILTTDWTGWRIGISAVLWFGP